MNRVNVLSYSMWFHPLLFIKFNEAYIYYIALTKIGGHNALRILSNIPTVKMIIDSWTSYSCSALCFSCQFVAWMQSFFYLVSSLYLGGNFLDSWSAWCYLHAHFHPTDTKELIFDYHLAYEVMEALKGE